MLIKYVSDYINSYHAQKVKLNKERIELVEYIAREIEPRLERKEIYFDESQINKCIRYIETFYFKLEDFQKFIISFIFLFWSDGNDIVFEQFLIMMGRGGGKNGLISGVTNYLQTPMHGIPKYHISLVANSEDQAKMSFEEIYDTIEMNEKLQRMFSWGKKEIKNRKTQSIIRYKTSNGNTKDGLRDGAVVFDEIHQYEDHKVTDVYISGLGKVANPREFYIGTDGFVREGFIDEMKELAHKVLKGDADFDELFPFICKLNDEQEVDDPTNWEMANPMFTLPMSSYAKRLYKKVTKQYKKLEVNPSGRDEFMTKRMNLPVTDIERSVATYEELKATKKEFPELRNLPAVGGFDFASTRDFIAVGALFKVDGDYVFKSHSFVRKEFVDRIYSYSKPNENVNGKRRFAPIRQWEDEGLLTVLDEPSMDAQHVVDWFVRMRDEEGYEFQTICGDGYKMREYLQPKFEEAGFEVSWNGKFEEPLGYRVEVIRNFRAIDAQLSTVIEDSFANKKINFGDNDMMRWYTNNVLRHLKKDGNVEYIKKEDIRRKTDGFKAFEAAMFKADLLNEVDTTDFYDNLGWFMG